jgi:lipopolysaccharide transport system ATP-binding protein
VRNDAVVVFESVWKKFAKGERHDSLRDLLPATAKWLLRRSPPRDLTNREFWALKDVSFDVAPGEALGIIGPNGAGKSTVLKLLTRILKPTSGRCHVSGRVGALIEVAAGFHPELTGIENIYLQGAIMGMRRTEIASKIDSIVDFAGVGEFIGTPVKRYSSGMNARLGFSIAAHLEPQALIIDEVLAVGDLAFQQKCLNRMQHFRESGVAIVFVSHNMEAIARLCSSVLLLNHGEMKTIGQPSHAIESYIRQSQVDNTISSTSEIDILTARLANPDENGDQIVSPGAGLTLFVTCQARERIGDLSFVFQVYRSTDMLLVYDAYIGADEIGVAALAANERIELEFRFRAALTRGQYHIACLILHNPTHRYLARLSPAAWFAVKETRTQGGVSDLDVELRLVKSQTPRGDSDVAAIANSVTD